MSAPTDKTFVRQLERKDGSVLNIHQSEIGDVGCVVWDAAIVLTLYLETNDFRCGDSGNILENKNAIELGAGTGIVGLQAACLGANVTITDLQDFVPLMKLNIEKNQHLLQGSVEAKCLKWGTTVEDKNPDYVFLADCIYYEESLEPLVDTITQLSSPSTIVFCCYEERTTGNKPELQKRFFELISQSFQIDEIPLENQDPVFRSEDIHIMKFRKKIIDWHNIAQWKSVVLFFSSPFIDPGIEDCLHLQGLVFIIYEQQN